jgi:4-amino-4-deoxy-L-arabinose transferase-like glycosyltransferase
MRLRHGMSWSSLSVWVTGCAGFGISIAFYGATLLPGVAYWDTGEMQTVPYILGIAHPTGFPFFVLAGWAFAHVLPFGEPAWRLSLFSALASAGAAGCLAVFVADLVAEPLVGIAAAAVFALGDVVWTRGVRAEVHDLALCCVAAALVAASRAARDASARWLFVAALAAGLGVATHPIALLAVPGIVLVAWPALRARSPRALAAAAALAGAPLLIYAYVPLRSAYVESRGLDPELALGIAGGAFWDDDAPSNARSFARYVAGTSFHTDASAEAAVAPPGVSRTIVLARDLAYREYGYLILALALSGFAYLCARRTLLALGLLSIALFDVAFAANFGAESDVARYGLEGFWAVAACAGVGAWWLARAIVGERPLAGTVLATALLIGGLWPTASSAASDVAHERAHADARPLVADVKAYTVPGSLVIASWTFAAPLAYDAYVPRTLGRSLVCGWPLAYASRFAAWRARFGHVYAIVPPAYDLARYGHRVFATARYQIAEVNS